MFFFSPFWGRLHSLFPLWLKRIQVWSLKLDLHHHRLSFLLSENKEKVHCFIFCKDVFIHNNMTEQLPPSSPFSPPLSSSLPPAWVVSFRVKKKQQQRKLETRTQTRTLNSTFTHEELSQFSHFYNITASVLCLWTGESVGL